MDSNDFREILDLEKDFFSNKYEIDENQNILRVVIYLLRFLISKETCTLLKDYSGLIQENVLIYLCCLANIGARIKKDKLKQK